MNLARFLSKRLLFSISKDKSISRPIIKLVIFGISLSLSIMIIAIAIVIGFQATIKKKLTGFSSHIKIHNLDNNVTYETFPITKDSSQINQIMQVKNVSHLQTFATKPGIIKTKKEIQGVVLYGIDSDFDWSFFLDNLTEGSIFMVSDTNTVNSIIISNHIANFLNFKIGDKADMYFIQKHIRARRFKIAGIYDTGMEEFDKIIALCDIKHVQKLNNWQRNEVSGYSIFLKNLSLLDATTEEIYTLLSNQPNEKGTLLNVINLKKQFPLIFNWFELINVNVWLILVLLLTVAVFNIISGILVLILEKTKFIAILKCLGMDSWHISKIFLNVASHVILKGMLLGNVIALLLLTIQYYFKIIKLNPELYFIDTVPINFRIDYWLLVNLFTFFLIVIIMMFPMYLLTKLSPAKAIRLS